MLTAYDIIKCQRRRKWRTPYLTPKGWVLFLSCLGALGGIIGIIIYILMITPFLK